MCALKVFLTKRLNSAKSPIVAPIDLLNLNDDDRPQLPKPKLKRDSQKFEEEGNEIDSRRVASFVNFVDVLLKKVLL